MKTSEFSSLELENMVDALKTTKWLALDNMAIYSKGTHLRDKASHEIVHCNKMIRAIRDYQDKGIDRIIYPKNLEKLVQALVIRKDILSAADNETTQSKTELTNLTIRRIERNLNK